MATVGAKGLTALHVGVHYTPIHSDTPVYTCDTPVQWRWLVSWLGTSVGQTWQRLVGQQSTGHRSLALTRSTGHASAVRWPPAGH